MVNGESRSATFYWVLYFSKLVKKTEVKHFTSWVYLVFWYRYQVKKAKYFKGTSFEPTMHVCSKNSVKLSLFNNKIKSNDTFV